VALRDGAHDVEAGRGKPAPADIVAEAPTVSLRQGADSPRMAVPLWWHYRLHLGARVRLGSFPMTQTFQPSSRKAKRQPIGPGVEDPFTALLIGTTDANLIRVSALDKPGKSEGADPNPRRLCPGQAVEFRCTLPSDMRPAQALLFERDAAGTITLLSHGVLLGGDVWYRDEVVVPRRDTLLNNAGPTGRKEKQIEDRKIGHAQPHPVAAIGCDDDRATLVLKLGTCCNSD